MIRRLVLALGAAFALAAVALWLATRPPGPVLYVGGPVVTVDAENRIAAALGTDGDRIVRVGEEAPLRAWADEVGARVVELDGRALVPGFIDAHGHFPGVGIYTVVVDLNPPPIGSVDSLEQLVALLAERAAETPAGEWVVGLSYDDTLLAERRHPTRHDLDRASRAHPIAIVHISGHLAVANTAALEAQGIGADTPDPEGGLIRREADGSPDGVLEETAAEPLQQRILNPGILDALRIVRAAGRIYLAAGVTTAQCGYAERPLLTALPWASRLGLVPVRMVLWPSEDMATALLDGSVRVPDAHPWVDVGAVKLIADGSIQGYTGYLSQPYHVPPGDDPSYRGYPRIPADVLRQQVLRFHEAGLQVAVHGNGDASIDDILDAFEAAQTAHPREDARHVVIHAQMTRDDQLDRMAALGIVPSFFSLHTYYWGDRHRDVFMGPARAARMSPARSAERRGIRFTIHADSPVVPMEPLRLIWAAVNRRSTSGAPIGPAERITPLEALRAVTIDAAWQHFEEDVKGSLEVDKLADLVILSRSPLDDPATLDEIAVHETVVGGRSRYIR